MLFPFLKCPCICEVYTRTVVTAFGRGIEVKKKTVVHFKCRSSTTFRFLCAKSGELCHSRHFSVEQTNVSHMGCISQKKTSQSQRFVNFAMAATALVAELQKTEN